jgi:hypothetical protein
MIPQPAKELFRFDSMFPALEKPRHHFNNAGAGIKAEVKPSD